MAIYLNALLDRYAAARAKNYGGAGYRSLIGALLKRLEITPAIRILAGDGNPLAQAQVVRYRFGDSELLAVVKENVGAEGIAGRDGVTVYNDARLGKVAREEVSIRLPQRFYVSDISAGRSMGPLDLVRSSITVGGALVLGLRRSPDSLTLSGSPEARLGNHPRFEVRFEKPGKHLLRCHFFAPDGTFLPAYARNVLADGAVGEVTLPSALSDPPGRYKLTITDLMSGASAEAGIVLR